jgi:hypothetical protein
VVDQSSLPFVFRAVRDTVIKTSTELSGSLPDSQKWFVTAGTELRGTAAVLQARHIRLESAILGGSQHGAETPRFAYLPHWQVLGASVPKGRRPAPVEARPVHPPSLVVGWMPALTETTEHFLHYVSGNETLVVTFDHYGARGKNLPWAAKFILGNGWSFLAVTSKTHNWFRATDLRAVLEAYASRGLFKMFRRVVFAGPSMGGFGAATFSSLSPGCTVVTLSPQSTMDPRLVPWERRFAVARRLDWSGRYADATKEVRDAAQVIIVFDPRTEPDRRHAERFPAHNRLLLPAPYLGHKVATGLLEMKVLKPFMQASIEGRMDLAGFQNLIRRRRHSQVYFQSLMDRARRSGRLRTLAYLEAKQAELLRLSSYPDDLPQTPTGSSHSAA